MCGVCGVITRNPVSHDQAQVVARLNHGLFHRGPDGEGDFRADHVCMAMRRLSIIDLSTGWQPLYNEDRSLALICNGEVYNFVELRKSLEARGHRFSTKSDCETILHLYEDFGDECVHHLRGMYAFALWDSRRRRVLIVRDRMGEKPLYLVERPGELYFCSEMRTLVQAGVLPMELDPVAVHQYFHFGFVPEPGCALKSVRKLPAGHLLTVDVDTWTVRERGYWRMEDSPPIEGDPPTLVRDELERISELIIRSDVPVGVALSGGLDSSIIAVLAQKNYPGTMHAITIGYEGTPWQDERLMARELAQHLKMPMHEVEITCDDMVRLFPTMANARDEPIADISGIGYWTVMRKARELNLPVMLAGQGGDELFWGYAWVRAAAAATRLRLGLHGGNGSSVGLRDYLKLSRMPVSYTGGLRWLQGLGGLRSGWNQWRSDRRGSSSRAVFYETEPLFREAMMHAHAAYTPAFSDLVRDSDPSGGFDLSSPTTNVDVEIMRMISQTYLRQNGIAQGDRLSMASSVELRLPFVDYRLVETVVGLTKARPSVASQPKLWLRDAVRDIVPAFVMNRRKRGFSPPWRQWWRALQKAHGGNLLDGYLREHGVLSDRGAREMFDKLKPPVLTLPRALAERALALEMWCRSLDPRFGASPRIPVGKQADIIGAGAVPA